MSATHELTLRSIDGASAEFRLTIIHPDECTLPFTKAAWVSMLSSFPDWPEKVRAIMCDEPTAKEADAVLESVELLSVENCTIAERTKTKAFVDRTNDAMPAAWFQIRARRPEYFASLKPGLSWRSAPLTWDVDEED